MGQVAACDGAGRTAACNGASDCICDGAGGGLQFVVPAHTITK